MHILYGEERHQLEPHQVQLVLEHPWFPLEAVAHLLALEHGAELAGDEAGTQAGLVLGDDAGAPAGNGPGKQAKMLVMMLAKLLVNLLQ